jgi:serine/threonine protein phosphatase 1
MFKWIRESFKLQQSAAAEGRGVKGIDVFEDTFATVYAVGDIHGRFDLLLEAEARIEADIGDNPHALVVYVGDFVDRGRQSSDVLAHLMTSHAPRFTRLCLRGNHDDLFLRFLDAPQSEGGWLDVGGKETLLSYKLDPRTLREAWNDQFAVQDLLRRHVPDSHREFLRELPYCARWKSYFFVHAGLQPGVPLHKQVTEDLLWIREPFLSKGPELPITVVHGHTPTEEISYGRGRIGIDTGAYATGRLTVLKITADGADPLPYRQV